MKKSPLFIMALIVILSGCAIKKLPSLNSVFEGTSSTSNEPQSVSSTAKTFKNLEELQQFLKNPKSGAIMNQALDLASAESGARSKMAAPMATGLGGGNASNVQDLARYTGTNNQVSGVEEPDIVKTDGRSIFYAHGDKVEIVKAYPSNEAEKLTTLKFGGSVEDLFVFKNKLVVYGRSYDFKPEQATGTEAAMQDTSAPAVGGIAGKSMPIWNGGNDFAFVKVYAIEDPKNPVLKNEFNFEGNPQDARMIGSYLYLITNKYSFGQNAKDVLPRIYKGTSALEDKRFPNVYYFDMPYQNYSFTSVNAMDLAADDILPNREVYLLAGGENVYVSQKNLYLTYTKYLNEQDLMISKTRELIFSRLSQKDQDLIKQVDKIDDAILSKDEKMYKVYSILMRYSANLTEQEQKQIGEQVKPAIKAEHPNLQDELLTTVIHKISLNGLEIAYQGEVSVPGRLLNQFSMDEYNSAFRVAVTKEAVWSSILDNEQTKPESGIYTYDDKLKLQGKLTGIASGERIYSARFMGNRAYLVTFVQTDPLFAIDLSDQKEPKILGEVKLPGYSNYLHPIDETHLIGLGKETFTNEWGNVVPSSLKLALFDVTDPLNPIVSEEKIFGAAGSDSSALYDHKAFLFDNETGTLAIPAYLTKGSGNQLGYNNIDFNGSLVFQISTSSIKEKGRISHGTENMNQGYFDYAKSVRRNLIIGDGLYSLSDSLLKINKLDNLSEIKSLEFQNDAEPQPVKPLIERGQMIK